MVTQNNDDMVYFKQICDWLKTRTGLHFPDSKQASILTRLYQLCNKLKIADLKTLMQHLVKKDIPHLRIELVNIATTNHTFFFREESVLNYFKDNIVPDYSVGNRRIWSAASSSGEELYTMAIIINQVLGPAALSRCSLLGTDISQEAIDTAEAATYPRSTIRAVSPEIRDGYFIEREDAKWQVKPEISRCCTFRRLNLKTTPWPFNNKFDLIACRNVLYYFDIPDQEALVERLYDCVVPGGYLLTSVTESLRDLKTRWDCITAGVYCKKG